MFGQESSYINAGINIPVHISSLGIVELDGPKYQGPAFEVNYVKLDTDGNETDASTRDMFFPFDYERAKNSYTNNEKMGWARERYKTADAFARDSLRNELENFVLDIARLFLPESVIEDMNKVVYEKTKGLAPGPALTTYGTILKATIEQHAPNYAKQKVYLVRGYVEGSDFVGLPNKHYQCKTWISREPIASFPGKDGVYQLTPFGKKRDAQPEAGDADLTF